MSQKDFMNAAFVLANEALRAQEVPVGCVFVKNGKIIASGRNTVNQTKNPTRHAEINCIDDVIDLCIVGNESFEEYFKNVQVYVTVEPCIMCADILHTIGVSEVIYGCANDRFGGESVLNVSNYHKTSYKLIGGLMSDEAMTLLKEFYKGTNPSAPKPKVKKNI